MLQSISSNPDIEAILEEHGLLRKMVYISKFFDEGKQLDRNSAFATKVVNSESIFRPFLLDYNPDNE